METINKIKKWVLDRNLNTQNPKIQMCKVVEELGELATGINKNNIEQQKDSIGDVIVTLICLSSQLSLSIEECIESAYEEIKDRKGKLIDGIS